MTRRPVPRPSTIPALDSMRVVGVLAVMTTHVGFHAGDYTRTGIAGHLVARLDVGVAIFFVLSGFLLSREWIVPATTGAGGPDVRRYLWKRVLRIYPAYVVCVVLALVVLRENHGASVGYWATTLAMVGIYTTGALPHGFTQTWSLGTEVAFYLALPVIAALIIGRRLSARRILVGVALMSATSVWWIADLAGRLPLTGRPAGQWLPAYLMWFAAGILLAAVREAPGLFPRGTLRIRALAASPGACWTLAAGLMLVASTPVAGPYLLEPATSTQGLVKSLLYVSIGTILIVPAAFGVGGRYERFLALPGPRHLGHISYSMFLVHMTIIELVFRVTGYPLFGGHFFQILALTLLFTLLAAELLYRFVERPFMRLRREPAAIDVATPSATTAA